MYIDIFSQEAIMADLVKGAEVKVDWVNPDFISPDGFDLCVNPQCKKVTPYKTDTPIEKRLYYVEGMGQHCEECYHSIPGGSNE